MTESQMKPPVTFWIVGAIAVLWNLMGGWNFILQVFMTDVFTAEMTAEQKELIMTNPTWMKIVFGIAVMAGLIGSIGLLIRRKWSVMVLMISLVAVIIQMGYSGFMTDALKVMGQSAVFPLVVVAFSAILLFYSRRSATTGYLN